MLTYPILLCIPFLQLGVSYWGSVASVSSMLVLCKWYRPVLKAALTNVPLMLVVATMFLSVFSYPSNQPLLDTLRVAREGLIFFLMVSLILAFRNYPNNIDVMAFRKPAFALCLIFLLLAFIQQYFYSRGEYFGFPLDWFSTENGTLPSEIALYFSNLRPNGPYSEPSYLGFILISFFLMFLPLARHSKVAVACLVVIFATGLATRSLSFLLALALVLPPRAFFLRLMDKIKIGVGAALVATLVLLTTSAGEVLSRLILVSGETGDASVVGRIFVPASVVPRFLLTYPFGVAFYSLPNALAPLLTNSDFGGDEIVHNGLINLVFEFGIFGVLMILVMLKAARDTTLRCYLVVAATFNGAFLAIDKFTMVVFAVAIYCSAQHWAEKTAPKSSPPTLKSSQ